MPDYVDINMDIPLGDGFRNPFGPGPTVSVEKGRVINLPSDDDVPVFLVVGDSTALGMSNDTSAAGISDYSSVGFWPTNAEDGSSIGYIWDKWMSGTGAGGNTITKLAGSLTDTNYSGTDWTPIHPRIGGQTALYTIDYKADLTDIRKGGPAPVFDMMYHLSGLFRKSNGDVVVPHVCFMGAASMLLGLPTVTNISFAPDFGGNFDLFNHFKIAYVRPAIKNLIDAGKNPFLAGLVLQVGSADALASIDGTSASATTSYQNIFTAFKDYLGVTTLPTILVTPHGTTPFENSNYLPSATANLSSAAEGFFRDGQLATFSPQGLVRDSGPLTLPTSKGVHFHAKGNRIIGKMMAGRYMNMLSWRKGSVIGPTLSGITY